MTLEDMLSHLHKLQCRDGSFPSIVSDKPRVIVDHSGFTTVLVLRSLRHNLACPELHSIRTAALQYLLRCRSSTHDVAFEFWPEDARPSWAPDFPADLDDTATMLVELIRHGYIEPEKIRSSVCKLLVKNRVRLNGKVTRPVWIHDGAFNTWIVDDKHYPNVVDCTVNANVASLLAVLDLHDLPGYQAAIDTIISGCSWAGDNVERLQSLSPFYPDATELFYAVSHAVESGVEQLREVKDQLYQCVQADLQNNAGAHCRNAYGDVVWKSSALLLARKLARNPNFLLPKNRFDYRSLEHCEINTMHCKS